MNPRPYCHDHEGTVYAICEDQFGYLERAGRYEPVPDEQFFFTKIGFTQDFSAQSRLKSLQTGNPRKLTIMRELDGTQEHEKLVHDLLRGYKAVGEWFDLPANIVRCFQNIDVRHCEELDRLLRQEVLDRAVAA